MERERFIELLRSTNREGVEDLITWICNSDFFETVASTKYHANEKGGLLKHSLHVYDNMIKLRDTFYPEMPNETIAITALLHDLSKANFYEYYTKNQKVYSPSGSKQDENGRFDWESVGAYKIRSDMDRDIIFNEHGVNSFMIANKFIKLTDEESAAIMNHHAGMDNGFVMKDLNEAMNRYPALLLLHMADMLSCYVDENPYILNE